MRAAGEWREELLRLADRYYDEGHKTENRAIELEATPDSESAPVVALWARADHYREVYGELCALVARLDPRPGAPEGPAKPW